MERENRALGEATSESCSVFRWFFVCFFSNESETGFVSLATKRILIDSPALEDLTVQQSNLLIMQNIVQVP